MAGKQHVIGSGVVPTIPTLLFLGMANEGGGFVKPANYPTPTELSLQVNYDLLSEDDITEMGNYYRMLDNYFADANFTFKVTFCTMGALPTAPPALGSLYTTTAMRAVSGAVEMADLTGVADMIPPPSKP